MLSAYQVAEDVWTLSLRSAERYGCEPATHLLLHALGGPSEELVVRIGAAEVLLSVEDGRLVQITVQGASSVLQDDVLFEGVRPGCEDEPL